MLVSLWLAVAVAADSCALSGRVTLESLVDQVLPTGAAVITVPGASPRLKAAAARARAFAGKGDPAHVGATISKRMAVLEDFLALCKDDVDHELTVLQAMLSLAVLAGELGRDFDDARARALAAARSVALAYPSSAGAHQLLAAALSVAQLAAVGDGGTKPYQEELEAELATCAHLDPALPCARRR